MLEKAPRDMRGGTRTGREPCCASPSTIRTSLAPLLPGIEREYEGFYEGITPTRARTTWTICCASPAGARTPCCRASWSTIRKDTVFWMHEVGGVKMEPAITVAGVKKGNMVVWPRGLVVRAVHEGVGLSRTWFATAASAASRSAIPAPPPS